MRQRAEDRLGPEGVAQLLADYQAGHSTKYLQRTYGLSQGAVLRLLNANGVARRQRGLSSGQGQEAIRLYAAGWSLTRIGDRFGKDHTVVRNAVRGASPPLLRGPSVPASPPNPDRRFNSVRETAHPLPLGTLLRQESLPLLLLTGDLAAPTGAALERVCPIFAVSRGRQRARVSGT